MALRLMAVHAHPDDESSKGAATYAHYLEQGAEVMIVTNTGGERGDLLNGLAERNPKSKCDIAGLRHQEMARATEIIGFEHRWLGFEDSGLPPEGVAVPPGSFAAIDMHISARVLVQTIREFKPHVIITYNENGGYPHPDHIRTHEITKHAWQVANDATFYPETGEPWQPLKLYYEEIFNLNRATKILDAIQASDPESNLVAMLESYIERVSLRPNSATTSVDVGGYFEKRDEALRAHASQVEPDHPFFFWPNDLLRRAWPFEDYRLAETRVETSLPESDLFQGVTE